MSLALFFNKKIVAKGNEFFTFIALNDITSAYNILRPDIKEQLSLTEFEEDTRVFVQKEKVLPIKWLNRSVKTKDGKTLGELDGVFTSQNGIKNNIKLQLEKVNGTWYINYYNFVPVDDIEFIKQVQKIGEEFINGIITKDEQSSYNLLHNVFKQEFTYDDFLKTTKGLSDLSDLYKNVSDWKGYQITTDSTEDDKDVKYGKLEALITFSYKEGDDAIFPIRFTFMKNESDGGNWKIAGFSFHPDEMVR